MRRYFHVLGTERAKRNLPHEAFSQLGDLVEVDTTAAFALAEGTEATPAEVTALALLHELLHVVVSKHGGALAAIAHTLRETYAEGTRAAALAFVRAFPPPSVFDGTVTAEAFLDEGDHRLAWACEEMLLLWVSSQNPAYRKIDSVAAWTSAPPELGEVVARTRTVLAGEDSGVVAGESLLDSLLAPGRVSGSVFEQLAWIEARWGIFLDDVGSMRRVRFGQDLGREEARGLSLRFAMTHGAAGGGLGAGHGTAIGGDADAPARFTADRDWMPETVVIAKNTLVWLAQLTKRFGRPIRTLGDIPEEALAELRSLGISTLWLIGLWERSAASRTVKVARGDHEAAASPYAIFDYRIADDLGGAHGYEVLRDRAARVGLRLGADMVPNHMGLTSGWIYDHPERFLSLPKPPYPSYRFDGPNLGDHPHVEVRLERGYDDRSDAAVVFERRDTRTGDTRYVYHGNDGTGLPWNDTAQLDYSRADVREAVMGCILHVCRIFPVVRFDAAMTLAKRHVRRLWFPKPGEGGAIASRAAHAMTDAEFQAACPTEFWRDVVDRVTAELPDTLLLAEAFWMMEGTFVRDFGMHRVYDSAFMHKLRSEDNAGYFAMLASALADEPEVLGRFVHFLSNPDEEPARYAFGTGDKYFGACAMMCTLPGLPLFSHGQVEAYSEKYGMEFHAPRWDEAVDQGAYDRHMREIAPLLRERRLFAGVENFELFVVEDGHGHVRHDVFAYANAKNGRTSLFVFHNGHGEVDVVLRRTVPKARPGALGSGPRNVADVLGTAGLTSPFVRARTMSGTATFARGAFEHGLALRVGSYGYLVYTDFEAAHTADEPSLRAEARADHPESRAAADELDASGDGLGGVPSVEDLLATAVLGDDDGAPPVLDPRDLVPRDEKLAAVVVEDDAVLAQAQVRVLEQRGDHRPEADQ